MNKISVIMPVYNDEEYLSQAIDSFLKQTLDDIELVCINDGSTDSSPDILNDYANKHDNIKVFTKENEGSGIARNFALQKSNGEYIAYLDSDDVYVNENALKQMYEAAIKYDADMVSANLKVLTLEGKFKNNNNLQRFQTESILSPQDYGIPYSFYKNIFKKSFLIENNIIFPDLLRGQDPVFLAEILTLIDNFPAIPIDLYGFRLSKRSDLLKMNTYRKRYDYIKHFKDTFDILTDAGFHKMKKDYEDKLIHFIKSFHYRYTKQIKDITYDVFKDDEDIINLVNEYFINPRVSVLIIVGNDENYLEESLKTILKQSLKQLELIFINSGSNDNSMKILNDLSLTDSRIRIIDEKTDDNASAKNILLKHVTGDYVFFFKLGDKIKRGTLRLAYKSASENDSDLVIFKADTFDEDGVNNIKTYNNYDELLNEEKYADFSFMDVKEYVLGHEFYPWFKLYKKGYVEKLEFNEGLDFNDIPFHINSILKAQKMSFVNKYLYHHWIWPEKNNASDIFKIIEIIEDSLIKENQLNEFENEFDQFRVSYILNNSLSASSEEYFKKAQKEFKIIKRTSIEKNMCLLTGYDLLLNSKSLNEFKPKFELEYLRNKHEKYDLILNQVKNENSYLQNKNNNLNEINQEIQTSITWKMTKPLRKLKNIK